MANDYQCPKCKSPNVSAFNNEMRCWTCGFNEVLEDYAIAVSSSCFSSEDERIEELADKVNDLEAISVQPGSIPRYHHEKTQQLQNKVNYLQKKINEHIDKPKSPRSKLRDIEI